MGDQEMDDLSPPTDYLYHFELDDPEMGSVIVAQDPLGKMKGGCGSTVWDAALVLSSYLMRSVMNGADLSKFTCVDIGAGTGIAGLVIARLGAHRCILTDKPFLRPLIDYNIKQNDCSDKAVVMPMEWGDAENLASIREAIGPNAADLIIGSDLFAWPDLFVDLAATFKALSGPRTRLLMAYEERDPINERAFFARLYTWFSIREIPMADLHCDYRSPEIHIFEARLRDVPGQIDEPTDRMIP